MKCKTHLVSSCAVNLFLLHPNTVPLFITTTLGASIGGVISDVDSRKAESTQILNKVNTITMISVLALVIISHFKLFDINKYIDINYINYLITFLLMLLICNIGSKTKHRSFTHSIIFIILTFFILNFSLPLTFIIPFMIGLSTHIVLDLLNHIGIALFFPSKFRFCFDLFDSDGLTNNILFYSSIFIICFITIFIFYM